ncbi:MAG: hypothetical protein ACFUZC_03610 [Chthoniobacteraceae bacterium]
MNAPITPGHAGEQIAVTYTPGYARMKLLTIAIGALIAAAGVSQMWIPLQLLAIGGRATAEATQVVKTTPGMRDQVFRTDPEIHAHLESRDRSSTFWNEFRFTDARGREVNVRSTVGSQLKPLAPLIDEDGLPTTLPVDYHPAHPELVSFPTLFSTWFVPGLMTLVGLGIVASGSVLLYWSHKPIELPHLG